MKLIIQIPCYNEADTLPETIQALPRQLVGVDTIEYLVVDDGSQDNTAEIAKEVGVHHIIRMKEHVGLALGFTTGIEACLQKQADLIVNTDADNQYNAEDIQHLINPILNGKADLVIGDRGVATLQNFSPGKTLASKGRKLGNRAGFWGKNPGRDQWFSGAQPASRAAYPGAERIFLHPGNVDPGRLQTDGGRLCTGAHQSTNPTLAIDAQHSPLSRQFRYDHCARLYDV